SPRTVRRYMPLPPKGQKTPTQRWMTFVRNHANAIIAADFFVVVTATFRVVYVLLIMEIATRRILHFNVTQHPTAAWTLQQFRACLRIAFNDGGSGEVVVRWAINGKQDSGGPVPGSHCRRPAAWAEQAAIRRVVRRPAIPGESRRGRRRSLARTCSQSNGEI